jgi:hypothetical protein
MRERKHDNLVRLLLMLSTTDYTFVSLVNGG